MKKRKTSLQISLVNKLKLNIFSEANILGTKTKNRAKKMTRNEDIKTKLEALKPLLKERYQVETLGFFGSYARGE
jgi:hypothetical protein